MDLNQAEVAVTTQHLIDIRQEKDNWLQMSDFGDMGEFLCTCSGLFPEEKTPEYRYTRWEEIPAMLINRQWLCPNFFEIREAMEQLDEPTRSGSSTGVTVTGMTSARKTRTCWWRTISNFMEMRPISTMSLARTAGMTACCTIRAYQATISTRVFPASRYSMTITIKAYKHIQDGNQLQRTGNAG